MCFYIHDFFGHDILVYLILDKEGALTLNHDYLMQCKKTFKHKVVKTIKDKNEVESLFI